MYCARDKGLLPPPRALAHDVIDVGGGEIIGDKSAVHGLQQRLVHAALEDVWQRETEAMALLQRPGPALEGLLVGRGRGGGDRDHLAHSGRVEIERWKGVAQRLHGRRVELAAVVDIEGGGASRREAL